MTNEPLWDAERHLFDHVAELGAQVADRLHRAALCLARGDGDGARALRNEDAQIDTLAGDLEDEAVVTLARHQPVAGDLRRIVAVMQVAVELERIADYAADMARLVEDTGTPWPDGEAIPLARLAERARRLFEQALGCFHRLDVDPDAVSTLLRDEDEVDALRARVLEGLLGLPMEERAERRRVMAWVEVAHYWERVADRAINLAERAVFAVEGRHGGMNDS